MDEFISKDFETRVVSKIMIAKDRLLRIVKEIKSLDLEFYKLPPATDPRRIAALDGGNFVQDFVGITIIPARAAGAIFEKDKNPIWVEENDVEILTLEEDTKNYSSLFRDYLEVKVALKLVEMNPEILFLDGSVTNFAYKGIPQRLRFALLEDREIEEDTPGDNFYMLFLNYISSAYKLIKTCIENDILLVGISKDSRANILINKLYSASKSKPQPAISDTTFVSLLSKERTGFTKPIEFSPKIRDIRQKIWKAAKVFQEKELQSFMLSYFILKEGAQPIRVDSLLPHKGRLKEIQEALVTYHDGNGFILPAYLTHNRAHMRNDLGKRIINYISEMVLDESPETYRSFFAPQRRDVIQ